MTTLKRWILLLVIVVIQVALNQNLKAISQEYMTNASQEISSIRKDLPYSGIQKTYQNPEILEKGCSMTVILFDPNVNEKAIWALESAADNIYPQERVCFLLQTSICLLRDQPGIDTDEKAFQAKAHDIQTRAKPHFLSKIQRGHVRMSIIDTKKYSLKSCSNFITPNSAWQNFHYWGSNEFISEDSDTILMIQDDVTVCHALHIDKWNDLAYVGGPWAPKKGPSFFQMCSSMPRAWGDWHVAADNTNVPSYPTEDDICSKHEFGPVGNGGFSLRSRKWMQQAILFCPPRHSGLTKRKICSASCNAEGYEGQEDMYFATVLRGMGAPMPTLYEGALFGSEMRVPDDFEKDYNLNNVTKLEEMVRRRWWSPEDEENGGLERYRMMRKAIELDEHAFIVSIGLHKIWDWVKLENSVEYMKQQCPYYEHIKKN